jgi:sugar/nucleoside kinase (ribokinase family)
MVRETLSECRARFVLADSRERIGRFRGVALKPNCDECARLGTTPTALARANGAAVFCTLGADGIELAEPDGRPTRVPGYPATGPTDVVGAGDSTSAGIACAVATGCSLAEAAAFGCLVASITVQQLGTTGTASPRQVRDRWREVKGEK